MKKVTQEGQTGENTTTPATINPLAGEKVGEGEPTTEVTKEPVDEIHNSVEKKYHKVIKEMSSIQAYQ